MLSILIDKIFLQHIEKVKPPTLPRYGRAEVGVVIRCFTEPILILTAHSLATIKLCSQEIYRAVTKAFQWGGVPMDELGGISNVGMNEKTFRQQILSAEANTIASLRRGLSTNRVGRVLFLKKVHSWEGITEMVLGSFLLVL